MVSLSLDDGSTRREFTSDAELACESCTEGHIWSILLAQGSDGQGRVVQKQQREGQTGNDYSQVKARRRAMLQADCLKLSRGSGFTMKMGYGRKYKPKTNPHRATEATSNDSLSLLV